jgi:very-short-patch-repair endonuclease
MASTEEGLEDSEEYEYDEKQLLEDESLLERSKTVMPGKRLIYHYRSNHEELINFSNYAFYDRNLRIVPRNSIPKDPPIDYRNVNGTWDSGINMKEAKEVVNTIKELLKNNKRNLTMGVITFNVKQKDLIEELLEDEARKDNEFAKALDREKERFNNEEYIGLFIKNIENVQGDERDIIIFSISYGFDRQGKFRYMFGPLNGAYGPNRLNVAISRAREKVIIISSFEPQDLKYEGSFEGPKLLRQYLDYTRYISKKDKVSADNKLENINKIAEVKSEDFEEYDSDFEGEVSEKLAKLGYQIKTQVGCKGYKIDLAVIHPNDKKRFVVGIECDGAKYHSSKSAKDRDLYRQGVLEESGWKILRIWSRDWWKSEDAEIKRIDREIKKLI